MKTYPPNCDCLAHMRNFGSTDEDSARSNQHGDIGS